MKGKNMPKISVIIPCYNVEQYVRQCVDSVCNQTMQDIEIICVDDGSTDGTSEILAQYALKDARIIIVSQENGGLSAARNAGLNIACGEYVAFLDSDDFIASDYYGSMYDRAKTYDADLVIGNDIFYWDDMGMSFGFTHYQNFRPKSYKSISNPTDKYTMLTACAVWNKLYRRKFIADNKLCFYDGKHIEDMPFTFMSVALSKKIAFQPFAFLFYRQRPGSIMSNPANRMRNAVDMLSNLQRVYFELNENKHISDSDKEYYSRVLLEMIVREFFNYYSGLHSKTDKQHFMQLLCDFVNDLPLNMFINPFHRLFIKIIKNRVLNKVFKIKYKNYKIEFKLFAVPVFKIRLSGSHKIKFLLFNTLKVHSYKDTEYLKYIDNK